ncbi:MAG: 1-deoxy-D-xylulose-5-phosphate reductoisomerase [Candidatus Omnitrophota bacterium]|nr:1-deoxy-D-xylulose-5-phosphate reductoisomerase [Candidatus Omnitrophota bacterium]
MTTKKRMAVLGSTGSIGRNALEVIAFLKDRFEIVALSADSNTKELAIQAKKFNPKVVCVRDHSLAKKLKSKISSEITILSGASGLEEIVSRGDVDMVLFAISGSACLFPLIRAVKNGKRVALANKEALVSGGSIVMPLVKKKRASIIPIDSEHSAIFQCLEGKRKFLKKIYLTATGGPLLDVPGMKFDSIPREIILNHPKWKMGNKISVDSATMMNKGLEIIEARWLFDVEEPCIDVLVHPEAIIHSMVELIDGTVFAQMGFPDMRVPIQYAITYPERFDTKVGFMDFSKVKNLSFREPDLSKFPCLRLAREALKDGGTYPSVLNAADEEAVNGYLHGKINFSRIPVMVEKVLERHNGNKGKLTIGDIIEAESWAREEIKKQCR